MREMHFRKPLPQAVHLRCWRFPKLHRPDCEDQYVHCGMSKIKEMPGTTLDTDIENTTKDQLSKLYHVIILNDDEHSFDYVIEMLQAIFKIPYATALAHTMEADSTGSSIILT